MKRINPKTGKFFKRGDLRGDGFAFHHYRYDRPLKDGYLTEAWYSPAAFSQQNLGMAKCRERNRDKARKETRKWQIANPSKVCAYTRNRHSTKINRTPTWLTKEHHLQIEGFYLLAKEMEKQFGKKYEVDHIVPLKGKTVSGLHVPWNLQILTKSENCSKNNSF